MKFSREDLTPHSTKITCDLTYREALHALKDKPAFRREYTRALLDHSFRSFYWECPALVEKRLEAPFQSVVTRADGLAGRAPERHIFDRYLDASEGRVVQFENLGGDALLVVPKAEVEEANYTDIASFLRGAPEGQIDEFWQVIGEAALGVLGGAPRWLSTSGGGVAWLHARLDTRPKYYTYRPYTVLD